MGRLIVLIIMAPFWVHFLLAGGATTFGYLQNARYEKLEQMAQSDPPPLTSISERRKPSLSFGDEELNVLVQFAINDKIRLILTDDSGDQISEQLIFILVAPDAAEGSKLAYGAIVLPPEDLDKFADWVALKAVVDLKEGAFGPVVDINGLRERPDNKSKVIEAIHDSGYKLSSDFRFIAPFIDGRAAGLAVDPAVKKLSMKIFRNIAAFFAAIGLFKLVRRLWRKKAPGPVRGAALAASRPAAAPAVQVAQNPNDFISRLSQPREQVSFDASPIAVPGQEVAPAVQSAHKSNDFIGRLSQRHQLAGFKPSLMAKPGMPAASAARKSAPGGGLFRSLIYTMAKKAGMLFAAVMTYLLFIAFFGGFAERLGLGGVRSLNLERGSAPIAQYSPAQGSFPNAPAASDVVSLTPPKPTHMATRPATGEAPTPEPKWKQVPIVPAAAVPEAGQIQQTAQPEPALTGPEPGGDPTLQTLPGWIMSFKLHLAALAISVVAVALALRRLVPTKPCRPDPFDRLYQRRQQERVQPVVR